MPKKGLLARVLGAMSLACLGCVAHSPGESETHVYQRHVEWSYQGETGPTVWGALDPSYGMCGAGQQQSPIDLHAAKHVEGSEIKTRYEPAALSVVHNEHVADLIDNGHTIQVNYGAASHLGLDGQEYALAQYHFHTPSEHTVNGQHRPMEMHLVHQSLDGDLAVVAVFINEGRHNKAFDPIWTHMPHRKGESAHVEHISVDVDDLLPSDLSTFRYSGSLTTPPCSENVRWLVVCEPIELSRAQIEQFAQVVGENNRPVQPVGARLITVDRVVLEVE